MNWRLLTLLLAMPLWTKAEDNLPVRYAHPAVGRISVIIPRELRGAYEHIHVAPDIYDLRSKSFPIYDCALPSGFLANLRDEHGMRFELTVDHEPEIASFADVIAAEEKWVATQAGKGDVEDRLSIVEIAGIKWVRIDQAVPSDPGKISGVVFVAFVGEGYVLHLRYGASGAGSADGPRPRVARKIYERYYPAVLKLLESVELTP